MDSDAEIVRRALADPAMQDGALAALDRLVAHIDELRRLLARAAGYLSTANQIIQEDEGDDEDFDDASDLIGECERAAAGVSHVDPLLVAAQRVLDAAKPRRISIRVVDAVDDGEVPPSFVARLREHLAAMDALRAAVSGKAPDVGRIAEEAMHELLNIDASMEDRVEVARKVAQAIGHRWPPYVVESEGEED